ncbi:MAG TPA: hypothetical protein VLZ12_03965 [Verrucomicrobiae bacterium]|nr:hypothetical protein [Verrucomicrobiae bacterium]
MYSHELIGLSLLLAVTVAIQLGLHWFQVCRALYKHGARFPTGLLFWRWFKELRHYRDLLAARGDGPSSYHVLFILAWFNLLLAFVVAVVALWQQTHPLR